MDLEHLNITKPVYIITAVVFLDVGEICDFSKGANICC